MIKRLFVAGLPFSTTEDELRTLFSQFGNVNSVSIITDRMTRKSKGFGFVEMENAEEADAAIKALHDSEYAGRKLVVNVARPREDRPQSGSFAGGGFHGRPGGFGRDRNKGFGRRREGGRGNFGRDDGGRGNRFSGGR